MPSSRSGGDFRPMSLGAAERRPVSTGGGSFTGNHLGAITGWGDATPGSARRLNAGTDAGAKVRHARSVVRPTTHCFQGVALGAFRLLTLCRLACGKLLHDLERFLHVLGWRHASDSGDYLVIRHDDERGALDKAVADIDAARILHRGGGLAIVRIDDFKIVGLRNGAIFIRGYG